MTAVSGPAAAAAAAASATTSAGIRILVCNFNSRLFGFSGNLQVEKRNTVGMDVRAKCFP
jgi:hypothetical protein